MKREIIDLDKNHQEVEDMTVKVAQDVEEKLQKMAQVVNTHGMKIQNK